MAQPSKWKAWLGVTTKREPPRTHVNTVQANVEVELNPTIVRLKHEHTTADTYAVDVFQSYHSSIKTRKNDLKKQAFTAMFRAIFAIDPKSCKLRHEIDDLGYRR